MLNCFRLCDVCSYGGLLLRLMVLLCNTIYLQSIHRNGWIHMRVSGLVCFCYGCLFNEHRFLWEIEQDHASSLHVCNCSFLWNILHRWRCLRKENGYHQLQSNRWDLQPWLELGCTRCHHVPGLLHRCTRRWKHGHHSIKQRNECYHRQFWKLLD